MTDGAVQNTDRELWREREGDHYADSIHVTERGSIGINVGGTVYVKSVQHWHAVAGIIEVAETWARLYRDDWGGHVMRDAEVALNNALVALRRFALER